MYEPGRCFAGRMSGLDIHYDLGSGLGEGHSLLRRTAHLIVLYESGRIRPHRREGAGYKGWTFYGVWAHLRAPRPVRAVAPLHSYTADQKLVTVVRVERRPARSRCRRDRGM